MQATVKFWGLRINITFLSYPKIQRRFRKMKIILIHFFRSQKKRMETKSAQRIIFYQRKIVENYQCTLSRGNLGFYNSGKDSLICYFLVFIAELENPSIVLLTKADAIATCNMFSNGTVPYERSHVKTLNAENLAYSFLSSKTLMAWFGATLDYEKREYVSAVSGNVIKIDNQTLFNSNFWLSMNVAGPYMGTTFSWREMDMQNNISGRYLINDAFL